jgi:hypothetical protein
LRRKDLEVARALEEKHRLIIDILHIPADDFDAIVDVATNASDDRDAREVLLAAIAQGTPTEADLKTDEFTTTTLSILSAKVEANIFCLETH